MQLMEFRAYFEEHMSKNIQECSEKYNMIGD